MGSKQFKIKILIYLVIILVFSVAIWLKFDYENNGTIIKKTTNEFTKFINNHNIIEISFTCPIDDRTIVYLDNNYMLANNGILYEVNYEQQYDNGYNCNIIDSNIEFENFYNQKIIYDKQNNFYEIGDSISVYNSNLINYYKEEIKRLKNLKDYSYIYFYDVNAHNIGLDNTDLSNKLLIDSRGNISVYTGNGYPTTLNLIENPSLEIIYNRNNYSGIILAIYRPKNNEMLSAEVKYLSLFDTLKSVKGLRLITTSGMYNEVSQNDKTYLILDEVFSSYFNNNVYSNGKYVISLDHPGKIYNIEKYIP